MYYYFTSKGVAMKDIFLERYPQLDLHGFDRESARVMVNDFILEHLALKDEIVLIIHGKGMGIVKQAVHETLKQNKKVLEYKTDNFNDGCTIVKLMIER